MVKDEQKRHWDDNIKKFSLPTITTIVNIKIENIPSTNPGEEESNEVQKPNKEMTDFATPRKTGRSGFGPFLNNFERELLFGIIAHGNIFECRP